MKYDAMAELRKHRQKYGERYRLPDGSQVTLKPEDLPTYLAKHKLKLWQPAHQASNIEESQIGIK